MIVLLVYIAIHYILYYKKMLLKRGFSKKRLNFGTKSCQKRRYKKQIVKIS